MKTLLWRSLPRMEMKLPFPKFTNRLVNRHRAVTKLSWGPWVTHKTIDFPIWVSRPSGIQPARQPIWLKTQYSTNGKQSMKMEAVSPLSRLQKQPDIVRSFFHSETTRYAAWYVPLKMDSLVINIWTRRIQKNDMICNGIKGSAAIQQLQNRNGSNSCPD